jgi:predicted Rossmann fold flavoprotein
MKKYKVAIIGGGPAGMIAAISAAQELKNPKEIVLIEKNEDLGKKLLLTGGGRCNITNLKPIKKFLEKLRKEDKIFLKHSLYTLDNKKLLSLFEEKGLEFKEEENGRCFPITDDATSILSILKEYLSDLKIDILLESHVTEVSKNKEDEFIIKTNNKTIYTKKLILATGGNSYPQTGSNGEGYNIAKNLGHSISNLKPGGIPLKVEDNFLKQLSGITLEDIEITYKAKKQESNQKNRKDVNKEKISKTRGNVLITHFGLSGPAILDISNFICENDDNKNEKIPIEEEFIQLDFIPAKNQEELNKKIIVDSQANGKTMIKNYLKLYLKNKFVDFFLSSINVSGIKTLSNMTKKDKNKIINNLKHFQIKIKKLPKNAAMITCGGVKLSEINPKTMESNLMGLTGLYFAGELLESYGPTGGYNLQIAFSTGYLAGKSASITTFYQ